MKGECTFFGKVTLFLSFISVTYGKTLLELEEKYNIPHEEVMKILKEKAKETAREVGAFNELIKEGKGSC